MLNMILSFIFLFEYEILLEEWLEECNWISCGTLMSYCSSKLPGYIVYSCVSS